LKSSNEFIKYVLIVLIVLVVIWIFLIIIFKDMSLYYLIRTYLYMVKICEFQCKKGIRCNNRALYGCEAKKPIYCKLHKKDKMIGVHGRSLCTCGKKNPSFGYKTDIIAKYCNDCKLDGMIDIKNKKCTCGKKQPYFGYKTDIIAKYCNDCKLDGMIDIKNKKCTCGKKNPYFGYKTDIIAKYCNDCKLDNMIDIKHKKCTCGKKNPSFGYKTDIIAKYCNDCKLDGMLNITSKKCTCGKKQPYFGYKTDMIAKYCNDCKLDGMIGIKNKKCTCGKQPSFGYKTDTIAKYCNDCKLDGMIDIKHEKCKANDTHKIPCDIHANKRYNGYCTHCFSNLFPNHPKTLQIRTKSKELQVVSYITNHFENFKHDKPLYIDLNGGCCPSKRRIDLRKLIGNTLLCIEVDEHQHKGYDKIDEVRRYNNLYIDFSGKYVFIRYNPDTYKVNGKSKNPKFDTRMNELTKQIIELEKYIKSGKNEELIEIYHMYYDE
jgi:hypothetical protein